MNDIDWKGAFAVLVVYPIRVTMQILSAVLFAALIIAAFGPWFYRLSSWVLGVI